MTLTYTDALHLPCLILTKTKSTERWTYGGEGRIVDRMCCDNTPCVEEHRQVV